MNPYNNLIEAVEGLICQGYDRNFVLKKDYLRVRNSKHKINYNEFEVQQIYWFADPDPKSEAIIYGIASEKHHLKGLVILSQNVLQEAGFKELRSKLEQ